MGYYGLPNRIKLIGLSLTIHGHCCGRILLAVAETKHLTQEDINSPIDYNGHLLLI